MENLEKLFDAFGELIYVVAMADGIIKKEETETLENILKGHPWAKEIKWSFDYEVKHHTEIKELYNKVLTICHEFGPRKEYQYLLEILEAVVHSDNVVNEAEQNVINSFTKDLTNWFQRDLDKHDLTE